MFIAIAIILPLLGAFGLLRARNQRASERCRRYLATLERWQPHGLADERFREGAEASCSISTCLLVSGR